LQKYTDVDDPIVPAEEFMAKLEEIHREGYGRAGKEAAVQERRQKEREEIDFIKGVTLMSI
jgi:hypothetical protein